MWSVTVSGSNILCVNQPTFW